MRTALRGMRGGVGDSGIPVPQEPQGSGWVRYSEVPGSDSKGGDNGGLIMKVSHCSRPDASATMATL
jgi:hypothetical protein